MMARKQGHFRPESGLLTWGDQLLSASLSAHAKIRKSSIGTSSSESQAYRQRTDHPVDFGFGEGQAGGNSSLWSQLSASILCRTHPNYAPLEQHTGIGTRMARSDIYALAQRFKHLNDRL